MIDVVVCAMPRHVLVVKIELSLISEIYWAVGTRAEILSLGGCRADVLKALDQDPDRKCGFQYPFCLEPIDIKRLMYEPSYNVLGAIHKFSFLQKLLPRINELSGKRWLQSTKLFRTVSLVDVG